MTACAFQFFQIHVRIAKIITFAILCSKEKHLKGLYKKPATLSNEV